MSDWRSTAVQASVDLAIVAGAFVLLATKVVDPIVAIAIISPIAGARAAALRSTAKIDGGALALAVGLGGLFARQKGIV